MTRARRGYVLAGGRSLRMGQDKARMRLSSGLPMAVAVAEVLRAGGLDVSLVRRQNSDEEPWLWPDGSPINVLYEPDDGPRHPLWGVGYALGRCGDALACFAPCDLPNLSLDAVQALLGAERGCVAHDGERSHPLLAVFPADWADAARQAALNGGSVRDFVRELPRVQVAAESCRNVNAKADLGV